MCEDTAGYVDSQGYDCSGNLGYDCLNEALYTEDRGYSLDDWQDIVESCPESCGLCESSGETWSPVPPDPVLMIETPWEVLCVTFAFAVFVLVI